VFVYDTVCLKKVYMRFAVLDMYRFCMILFYHSTGNGACFKSKSEDPCI